MDVEDSVESTLNVTQDDERSFLIECYIRHIYARVFVPLLQLLVGVGVTLRGTDTAVNNQTITNYNCSVVIYASSDRYLVISQFDYLCQLLKLSSSVIIISHRWFGRLNRDRLFSSYIDTSSRTDSYFDTFP